MTRIHLLLFLASAILAVGCISRPKGGPIEDTYWELTSYKVNNTTYALADTLNIRMHFSHGGQLRGQGLCNAFQGQYTTEGGKLMIRDFTFTEKTCPSMQVDQEVFSLLAGATGYTVDEKGLVIFAQAGQLKCRPLDAEQSSAFRRQLKFQKLLGMLPPMTAPPGPLHIYPTMREDNLEDYPYKGQQIDTALYDVFDEQTSKIWRETGGRVFAIGSWNDYYLFRIPGRYISSDIALFRLENGQMRHVETVAWMWCDEGWCNQQDAWLIDLDRDGRFDIVQRYQLTDDKGKLIEDMIHGLRQMENGLFDDADEFKPDPSYFKLAKVPMPNLQ